jgi:hypothetical protein
MCTHLNTPFPLPPKAAKDVVLAPKPVISDDSSGLEPQVLQQLLAQMGTLASVYHKPADTFVSRQRLAVARAEELQVGLGAPAGATGTELSANPLEPDPPTHHSPPPHTTFKPGGAQVHRRRRGGSHRQQRRRRGEGGAQRFASRRTPSPPQPARLLAPQALTSSHHRRPINLSHPQAPMDDMLSGPIPAVTGGSGGGGAPAIDLLGGDLLGDEPEPPAPPPAAAPAAAAGLDDLLGGMSMGGGGAAAAAIGSPIAVAAAASADPFAMFGGDGGDAPAAAAAAPAAAAPASDQLPVLLTAEKGKGLSIRGAVVRSGGAPAYQLALHNGSSTPVDGLMLQLNANAFGLAPANQVVAVGTLAPGASGSSAVPLSINPAKVAPGPASSRLQVRRGGFWLGHPHSAALYHLNFLNRVTHSHRPISYPAPPQVALKTNQLGVFYWDDALPLPSVLEEGGTIDGAAFLSAWRALAAEEARRLDVTIADIEAAKAKLAAVRLFVLAHRPVSLRGRAGLTDGGRALQLGVAAAAVFAGWTRRRKQGVLILINRPTLRPPGPRQRPGRALRDGPRPRPLRPHAAAGGAAAHARRAGRRRGVQVPAAGPGGAGV